MNQNEFIDNLKEMNIILSDIQQNQLNIYYNLLVDWNTRMNLTGITEEKQVYLKHFYDSLTICKAIDLSKEMSLCDVGTGAGFPGMVLKIVFPNLKITLVDSLQKRLTFLESVIENLQLKNIELIHARAEVYAKEHREEFDIATARAVAPLNILLEYCIPLVKNGGYFIPLKANIQDELINSTTAMKLLQLRLENKIEFTLPIENSQRTILVFKKINFTPKKFPRKYNEIKRNPL